MVAGIRACPCNCLWLTWHLIHSTLLSSRDRNYGPTFASFQIHKQRRKDPKTHSLTPYSLRGAGKNPRKDSEWPDLGHSPTHWPMTVTPLCCHGGEWGSRVWQTFLEIQNGKEGWEFPLSDFGYTVTRKRESKWERKNLETVIYVEKYIWSAMRIQKRLFLRRGIQWNMNGSWNYKWTRVFSDWEEYLSWAIPARK